LRTVSPVLDVARDFAAIVGDIENIIVDFNDFFVDTTEISERIDMEPYIKTPARRLID